MLSHQLITPQDSMVTVIGATLIFLLLKQLTGMIIVYQPVSVLECWMIKMKKSLCYRDNALIYLVIAVVLWLCLLFHISESIMHLLSLQPSSLKCTHRER